VSWTTLAHTTTGALITATFLNNILDDLVVLKTSIDDNGHIYDPVIQTKTTTYSVVGTDDFIICTSGTFTVTLPTAVGRAGKIFKVKNTGAGVITLATTGGQTIDGAATYPLSVQNFAVTVESDGANWQVI
jgi:hypothetical protein